MRDSNPHETVCRILSGLAVSFGAFGMTVSLLFMASVNASDITVGTAGFIAGSVLIGSGLVSFAMLARTVRSVPGAGQAP